MFFAKMSIVENGQFYRFLAKIRQISRNFLPQRKKQGVGRIDKIIRFWATPQISFRKQRSGYNPQHESSLA